VAATASDLALFFQLLFTGQVVHDQALLDQMHADVPSHSKSNYCLGIRRLNIGGLTGYYHGGFWGTDVIYFPELKASIAIFVLERSQRDISADICKAIGGVLKG
jgi:D-alanyl-D-alanine carboxypeptidase